MESQTDGLARFYSSQAEVMIAQYENINRLLGPTSDWTHPGTHCELLLRDFIRSHVLQSMSVDKGFIYGRCDRDGREYHGPEIDILIHNTKDYRPVFRLGDFVIVQPEAVLGIIQVKRTFRAGKEGSLVRGIDQVVSAKQHLLDVTIQEKLRAVHNARPYADFPDMRPVYSAVVAFEDETAGSPDVYREVLLNAYRNNRRYAHPECKFDTSVYALPEFVGSLKRVCFTSERDNVAERRYWTLEAFQRGINISLQLLLAGLTNKTFQHGNKHPPFGLPEGTTVGVAFQVPRPDERLQQYD